MDADAELDAILAWGEDRPDGDYQDGDCQDGDCQDGDCPDGNHDLKAPLALVPPPSRPRNGDLLYEYDAKLEEKEYSRALMSPADLAQLKDDIAEHGFLTIEGVRGLIQQNTVKETQEARGETYAIDPEMMMQIDARINYRVFITGDNVYTREELFAHYPFEEFQTSPEDVFVQQEVGVFPPKKWALEGGDGGGYEFVARDVGDNEEFIMIEDLVGRAARKNYKMKRSPVKIVKTKVYLGKDRWEDFSAMKQFVRSFQTFVTPLMIASQSGDASSARALTYLFGAGDTRGAKWGGPLAIQDAEGARLDRERQALAAIEAKARALQQKEDELRAREEALFRSLGLDPPERQARDFMAEAQGGDADDAVPL